MDNLQIQGNTKVVPKQVKSISHALEVLNDAAKDSSSDIKHMINQDYKQLKNILSETSPEVKSALREIVTASQESVTRAKDKVIETTKAAAEKVDETAHKNPWYFIAGSAVVGGILGFFLGRRIHK